MALAKLKPPPDDPLRQALVDALAAADEAAAQLHAHRNAVDRTRAAQRDAERALEVAKRGIDLARSQHAQAISNAIASADGDDPLPPSSIRLAKLSVADCEEEIAALKEALRTLKSRTVDYEHAAKSADDTVDACISEILREPVQLLIDRLQSLISQSTPIRRQLNDLLDAHLYNDFGFGALQPLDPQLDIARRIVMQHSDADIDKVAGEFAAIRVRLRADPHADIEWPD